VNATPTEGSRHRYGIKVNNYGPDTATNTSINFTAPPGTTLAGFVDCPNVGLDPTTCEVGDIAPNSTQTFSAEIDIPLGVTGTITAWITADSDLDERDPLNNLASRDVDVSSQPR